MSDAPPSAVKRYAKSAINGLALIGAIPWLVGYGLSAALFGRDRALEGASQAIGLLPGMPGVYIRRAFLRRTIACCDATAEVHFGTLLSQVGTTIGANVYVGPRCHLGLVTLENDCLIAAGVHVPSGGATHRFDAADRPIREQGGERSRVTIGTGAWIGSATVVLADVGAGTVVGAGSVVTKALPPNVIAAGVPARVLRDRFPSLSSS